VLSVGVLNLLPIIYFVYVVLMLGSGPWTASTLTCNWPAVLTVFFAVLLAFGIFGFYRFWIVTIEKWPHCFYSRGELETRRKKNPPDYDSGLVCPNFVMAMIYFPLIPLAVYFLAREFLKVAR
jgi:hypothetical protein